MNLTGKYSKDYKRGNTLSETLIALAIVGVVFTVALGTMIADFNKNQVSVKLKIVYSTLSQAFNAAVAKNGAPVNWNIPDEFNERVSNDVFETYLKPQLIILKDCKNSVSDQCDYIFKDLSGTEISLNSTWTRFYLNNGMFVAMQAITNPTQKVLYFYVDTNGKKRLNVVGRDIFLFEYWLQNDDKPSDAGQLFTYGHEYSREELISTGNENNCNSSKNGNYCSSLIMHDNWEIKLGYPWAQARYAVK